MSGATTASWASSSRPLAAGYDLLLLDLDGVVYVGRHAVPGAAPSLARALRSGLRCSYVTNNAARPPSEVAEHLRELGISAQDGDVVTSAQEGAELLPAGFRPAARCSRWVGQVWPPRWWRSVWTRCSGTTQGVSGVLQGYGPGRRLARPGGGVVRGQWRCGLGGDQPGPDHPDRPRHGAGQRPADAVVAGTTGVSPLVTGKPGPGLFRSAIRRAGGGRALVVGDRLDTDIAGAVAAELDSLLVLTGVTGAMELLAATAAERPSYLARDLSGLWEGQPVVAGSDGGWACGGARAQVRSGPARAHSPGCGAGFGGRPGPLAAAAPRVWAASDQGEEVDVPAAAASLLAVAR